MVGPPACSAPRRNQSAAPTAAAAPAKRDCWSDPPAPRGSTADQSPLRSGQSPTRRGHRAAHIKNVANLRRRARRRTVRIRRADVVQDRKRGAGRIRRNQRAGIEIVIERSRVDTGEDRSQHLARQRIHDQHDRSASYPPPENPGSAASNTTPVGSCKPLTGGIGTPPPGSTSRSMALVCEPIVTAPIFCDGSLFGAGSIATANG